jgi:hypothetical protein
MAVAARTAIQRTEIDGVPVFWTDVPGPCLGTLVFRTGFADETLPTSGVTHAVEHLALRQFASKRRATYNGHVMPLQTVFHAEGSPEDVATFLSKTAAGMANLPLGDLDHERRVLETEDANDSGGPIHYHRRLRWGATGHALPFFVSLGLRRLTADHVAEWAAARFTRGNAAVWLTAPPPDGLRFDLPDGERVPPPPFDEPEASAGPTHHTGADGIVTLSLVGERGGPFGLVMEALVRRLEQRLRYEQGITYEVGGYADLLEGATVFDVLWADFMDENANQACETFLSVCRELAEDGPTEEEMKGQIEDLRSSLDDPAARVADLDSAAEDELLGREHKTNEEVVERDERVRREEAAEALRAALESAILTTPESVARPEGFGEPPEHHAHIEGRTYTQARKFYERGPRATLTVGDAGFATKEDDCGVDIELGRLAAVLRYPDDERLVLIRDCGCEIDFLKDQLKHGDEAVRDILERVPQDIVIPMREVPTG